MPGRSNLLLLDRITQTAFQALRGPNTRFSVSITSGTPLRILLFEIRREAVRLVESHPISALLRVIEEAWSPIISEESPLQSTAEAKINSTSVNTARYVRSAVANRTSCTAQPFQENTSSARSSQSTSLQLTIWETEFKVPRLVEDTGCLISPQCLTTSLHATAGGPLLHHRSWSRLHFRGRFFWSGCGALDSIGFVSGFRGHGSLDQGRK